MGKIKKQKTREKKIFAELGKLDNFISVLQISINPAEYIAILKFDDKSIEKSSYIEVDITDEQAKSVWSLKNWLLDNFRYLGRYSKEQYYRDGAKLNTSKNKDKARTPKQLHEFTSEVAENMHRKSLERIRKNRKRAEGLEKDFLFAKKCGITTINT